MANAKPKDPSEETLSLNPATPAAQPRVRDLTPSDLRKLTKSDRDRPAWRIFLLILLWFVILRAMLTVTVVDTIKRFWTRVSDYLFYFYDYVLALV